MRSEVSVVFPAFNEEDNIIRAVTTAVAFLKKNFKTYEIIIVNNGSTDSTGKIINSLKKSDKNIKSVTIDKNIGYGKGLRTGLKRATYNLVFYTDSDNQFDISEMKLLMPLSDKYDIVCGYRKNRQDPFMRIVIASVYNFIINILFNLHIRDIDCSFKIYKTEIFKKIDLHSNTGLIDAEILIKAKKLNFTFSPQVAITHYPRLQGKTSYEIGPRGKIIAFIRPSVIQEILIEIKSMWGELR